MNRAERRKHLQPFVPHTYDEDAVCIHCGFDGAEWHHWRFNTHEGHAMQTPAPSCNQQFNKKG